MHKRLCWVNNTFMGRPSIEWGILDEEKEDEGMDNVFVLIVIIPFINGILYSFTDWNGVTGTMQWIGLRNYAYLTRDALFLQTFWLTAKFAFFAVLLTINIVGFSLALLVTQKLNLKK